MQKANKFKLTALNIFGQTHWPVTLLGALSSFTSIVLPLVIVRLLSPSEVGEFKVFFLYLAVAPALTLTNGLMSGIAFWAGLPEKREAFSITLVSATALTLLASLLLLILIDPSSLPFFSNHTSLLSLFCISMVSSIIGSLYEEIAIASGFRWHGALYGAISEAVRIGGLLITLAVTRSVTLMIEAFTILSVAKATIGILFGFRYKLFALPRDSKRLLTKIITYSIPVSIAGLCAILVRNTDQLFLSYFLSKSDFALYAIGCLSLAPIFTIEQSVTRVLIPSLSKSLNEGLIEQGRTEYREAVATLMVLMIPVTGGLILFAKPIIEVLFTDQYHQATNILRLFSISYLCLCIPENATARARGDAKWILRSFAISAVWTLIASIGLALIAGTQGALIGAVSGNILLRILALRDTARTFSTNIARCLPFYHILRIALITAVLILVSIYLRSFFVNDKIWFAVSGGIFGLISLFIWWDSMRPLIHSGNKAPKVLLITQTLYTGGLEKLLVALASGLQDKGMVRPIIFAYQHCLSQADSNFREVLEKKGISVEILNKSKGFSFTVIRKISSIIRSNKISAIHTHDLGGLIYGILGSFWSGRNPRVLHTQHSFIHLAKHKRYKTYEKIFTKCADGVSAVSEVVQSEYKQVGINPRLVKIIPTGVVVPSSLPVRSEEALLSHKSNLIPILSKLPKLTREVLNLHWIIYLARCYPGKGQDHALALWENLQHEIREQCFLIFVGPPTDKEWTENLMRISDSSPLSSHIAWAGGTDNPQDWLKSGSVFLSLSEYEGYPLAPLEALVTGVPSVLSDIPGHEPFRNYSSVVSINAKTHASSAVTEIIKASQSDFCGFRSSYWENTQKLRDTHSLDIMVNDYQAWYQTYLPNK